MEKVEEKVEDLSEKSMEKESAEELATEETAKDETTKEEAANEEAVTQEEAVEPEHEEDEENSSETSSKKSPEALIKEAQEMVQKSDSVVKDCMEVLDEDIEAYEEEKERIISGSLNTAEALLEEIGFEPEVIEDIGEEHLSFENEEAVEPLEVKNLSSGKFGAFILALIAGLAVVIAWIYAALEKLGINPNIMKIPTKETQDKVLSWIGGGMTGGEGNPIVGIAVLAVSALLVMVIIYKIRVYLREVHNRHLAEKINEEAKFYCTKKEECKKEMEKVSEHINKVIDSLKTYDIFFDELNAKIRRILHLEGKVPFNEYHPKSKMEIERTNTLIDSFRELVMTPMAAENGSLSDDAKKALKRSNRALEIYREELYQ